MENTYHLCTYQVRSGDQEYIVYELRENMTQEAYELELLNFCRQSRGQEPTDVVPRQPIFEEWAYDDRIYSEPVVTDLTEEEYAILRRYL